MAKHVGFVGFALPAIVAAASLAGVVGALAAWQWLRPEQDRALAALIEAVDARTEAGQGALRALDTTEKELRRMHEDLQTSHRKVAEHRATELAVLATYGVVPPALSPQGPERLGRVWPQLDRATGVSGSSTVALSIAHPQLGAALKAAPASSKGPLIVRAAQGVYAVGPKTTQPDAGRALAFVPILTAAQVGTSLGSARAALGNVAAPPLVPVWTEHPEWPLGVAGLLAALFVFAWARMRVSAPILETLDAARDFIHGDPGARADELRGGREAREVARAVNGLVERAVRLEGLGRAAKEEDIQAAAVAIEGLGKGDLRSLTPRLASPFGPLSRALDQARRDLLLRVDRLHDVSSTVAEAACTMAPGARLLHDSSLAQRHALEQLSEGLTTAQEQVSQGEDKLRSAMDGLKDSSAEQRRGIHELKATLSGAARRSNDLSATAKRLQGLTTTAQAIEQALAMLGTWAASGGQDAKERERATQLAGEGKAAFENIIHEAREMQADLSRVAESLQLLGEGPLQSPPDPSRSAGEPLMDTARGLVRGSEMMGKGLSGWLKAVRQLGDDTSVVASAAEAAAGSLGDLSEALSDLRVGDAFETALIERLKRAKAEAEAATDEALTADGSQMMFEVQAAADAANARVKRLIHVTESTLDVLRG